MENPFRVWLAVAIVLVIFIRWAVVLRHRYVRNRRGEDAETSFEKDVEWQLQHELREAVDAANIPAPRNEVQETWPLLPSLPPSPHITFTDDHLTARSWHDFKTYSKTELPRVELRYESQHEPEEVVMNGTRLEQPLYINPKQFHRILKRRMTRQLIEEYFRSRPNGTENNAEVRVPRGRRPRGQDGRFLTAEQIDWMPNGSVVVA